MPWLILIVQVAGPVLSALNFVWNLYPDAKAFQAGEVVATFSGFYLPFSRDLILTLIGLATPYVAPKWREILVWVRDLLPDGSGTDLSSVLSRIERENRKQLIAQQKQSSEELAQKILESSLVKPSKESKKGGG